MIKAIIFDIDGVLIDSDEANAIFYQNLIEKFGYPRPTRAEASKVFSLTLLDGIKFLTKEKSGKKIRKVWSAASIAEYNYELLKPTDKDETKIIKELRERYRLAIVTNREKDDAGDWMRVLHVKNPFEVVVTYEDFSMPKPDPEPLLVAAKRLKLKPQECIYVGDSQVDVTAAHAAKMRIIGYSQKRLKDADAMISAFKDLEEAIELLK